MELFAVHKGPVDFVAGIVNDGYVCRFWWGYLGCGCFAVFQHVWRRACNIQLPRPDWLRLSRSFSCALAAFRDKCTDVSRASLSTLRCNECSKVQEHKALRCKVCSKVNKMYKECHKVQRGLVRSGFHNSNAFAQRQQAACMGSTTGCVPGAGTTGCVPGACFNTTGCVPGVGTTGCVPAWCLV